jgi:hypothetical protein
MIAIAQTGTGKTASFVLADDRHSSPMAVPARRMPRSLILEPTRELAAQVAENFEKYGKYHKLSMALLIGGVQMGDQVKALEKGVDVLIATPGRLMDLFERGKILLTGCSLLVIDEADRMLDMGFIPDIENICTKLPTNGRRLLFSATMPPPIKKLADKFLSNPKIGRGRAARRSEHQHHPMALVETETRKKRDTLRKPARRQEDVTTAIIFCNRKTTVRELAKVAAAASAFPQRPRSMATWTSRDRLIAMLDRFKDRRDQHPRRLRRGRARAGHQGRQPCLQLSTRPGIPTTMFTALAAPVAQGPRARRLHARHQGRCRKRLRRHRKADLDQDRTDSTGGGCAGA